MPPSQREFRRRANVGVSLHAPKPTCASVGRSPPYAEARGQPVHQRRLSTRTKRATGLARAPMLRDQLHSCLFQCLTRNFDGTGKPAITKSSQLGTALCPFARILRIVHTSVTEKPRNSKSWCSWRGVNSLLTTTVSCSGGMIASTTSAGCDRSKAVRRTEGPPFRRQVNFHGRPPSLRCRRGAGVSHRLLQPRLAPSTSQLISTTAHRFRQPSSGRLPAARNKLSNRTRTAHGSGLELGGKVRGERPGRFLGPKSRVNPAFRVRPTGGY